MTEIRQWFCNCDGKRRELVFDLFVEDDSREPACPRCGATPSSDPKRTLSFIDRENHAD